MAVELGRPLWKKKNKRFFRDSVSIQTDILRNVFLCQWREKNETKNNRRNEAENKEQEEEEYNEFIRKLSLLMFQLGID